MICSVTDSTDFFLNDGDPLILTLNDSQRLSCFSVGIVNNDVFEDPGTKFFTVFISSVSLSNPELRVLLSRSRENVTVVIMDDEDRNLTIGFDNAAIERTENVGSVELCISVTSPPPEQSLSVQGVKLIINTQAGTAGI